MKHRQSDVAALRTASEALEAPLTASQAEALLRFEQLLRERAIPFGMVAASDAPRLRERHILDCLRAAAVVGDAATALDLGSGAGLPGIVVAIASPRLSIGLVESRRRRTSFLELTVGELGLDNVQVFGERAEALSGLVDLCFARAFAPLPDAWAAAERALAPGGRLVYFAGGSAVPVAPSGSRILEVREAAVLESAGALVIMSRL